MKKILLFTLILFTQICLEAQTIRYVKQGGSGNKNGTSWTNASGDIQAMINTSNYGDQIWVAKGNYIPNRGADNLGTINNGDKRKNAFVLKNGVKLFGGFAGNETSLNQRNIYNPQNKSTLNGGGYCYHVVYSVYDDRNTRLDGFTITGGKAILERNIVIVEGRKISRGDGAGMYASFSSPTVLNCIFEGNIASNGNGMGGGFHNYKSAPWIGNCIFRNNTANNGGGIGFRECVPRNTNNLKPVVNNCLFYNNKAIYRPGTRVAGFGGAIEPFSSDVIINHCTFARNTAVQKGGAIYSTRINAYSNIEIYNSIFKDNSSRDVVMANGTGDIWVKNSILQHSSGYASNINNNGNVKYGVNPNFKPNTYVPQDQSLNNANDANYVSPVVDKAIHKYNLPSTDVYGNPRKEGDNYDIGAFELTERYHKIKIGNITKTYGDNNNTFTPNPTSQNYKNQNICLNNYTYQSSNPNVALVQGNSIKIKKGGTITITVKQRGGKCGTKKYASATKTFTLTINKKVLTITGITANNKAYDGNTNAMVSGGTLNGVVGSDNVSFTKSGSATFNNKNVGTNKPISLPTYNLTGASAGNYTLTQPSGIRANITKKTLTITGVTANNKVYDGNTNATVSAGTLNGVIGSDNVSINKGTGKFDTKDVGVGKTVTLSGYSLTGTDANNYSITQPNSVTANITKKTLTITGITANNKVYDRNKNATLSSEGSLNGVIGSDNVSFTKNGSVTFDNKNVGTNKPITLPTYSLTGASVGNYTLTQPSNVTADITKKALTITGVTADNKTYDGNTNATVSVGTLNGVIGTDNISINKGTGTFDTKDVGVGKTVTLSGYSLTGTDANNYSITQPSSVNADITKKTLTITGVTASNKVYDGNTRATVSAGTLNGVEGADDVKINKGIGTFDTKDVGIGKTVTLSGYTLTGTDANNYSLTQPSSVKADITKKALMVTITGITAENKVYDGNTNATVSVGTLNGIEGSDDVKINKGIGTFDTKDVGVGKTVTLSGYSLTGTDANNYSLTQPSSIKADITKKPITITGVTAENKVYDGNTNAVVSVGTLNGVVGSDNVSINKGTGTFDTKDVAVGKTVTLSGYTLTGTDADNYSVTQPSSVKANITKKGLMVTITGITAENKVYDGNTNAVVSVGTLNGIEGSDDVKISKGIGNFDTKDVGVGKTVTLSGYTLTGTDANNYSLTQPNSIKADITKKALTITGVTAENKVYDGNTNATVSVGTLNGVVGSEKVTLNKGIGKFDTKNVGVGKTVTLSGYNLTGADANNYSLTQPSDVKADITKKKLKINISINDKYYDATTTATVKGTPTLIGTITNDDVKLDISSVKFDFIDKNIGENKEVNYTGNFTLKGRDAQNYDVEYPTRLKATIKDNYEIKKEDVITWNQDLVLGCDGATITLTATSESGLPITYTCSNPTIGVISGNEFHMTKRAVKIEITAYVPGDELNYRPLKITREIEFKLKGFVRQHFDDTLFFDNSSKEFVAWEWYKNDELVPNINKQYYSEKTRLNGEYYARVTDINGDVYETCPIYLENNTPRVENLKIYPNPVEKGTNFYLETGFSQNDLVNAKITVFDISGRTLQTINNVKSKNSIKALNSYGFYIVMLELANGEKETKNLLVK